MADPQIPLEQIDADAQKVIRRLVRNGYEAYLVGGCVRDLLLSRKPKDFDVATSATPAELREIFRNCRIIGRRFRLAHVFFGPKVIETATFRANPREVSLDMEKEGDAEAPAELLIRHDNVFGTAEEDACRRDFTINGLFYDLDAGRVIDYVGGMNDLALRSVRTIGDPDIRFREDPVRILRAIKFAARLGFDIEDKTYRALIAHGQEIEKSSPPRVLEEVYRLLRGGAALESLILLRETGILRRLIPELDEKLSRGPTLLDAPLRALDQVATQGDVLSNATLLCLLVSPELAPLLSERGGERLDPIALIDQSLGPLVERLRVSRRDMERARQLVLVQRRIWQVPKKPGKHAGLAQREWFPEALAVHLIWRIANGVPREAAEEHIEPWLRLCRRPPPSDTSQGAEEERRGSRRRARRLPRAGPLETPPLDQSEAAPSEDEIAEEAALSVFTEAMTSGSFDD